MFEEGGDVFTQVGQVNLWSRGFEFEMEGDQGQGIVTRSTGQMN